MSCCEVTCFDHEALISGRLEFNSLPRLPLRSMNIYVACTDTGENTDRQTFNVTDERLHVRTDVKTDMQTDRDGHRRQTD